MKAASLTMAARRICTAQTIQKLCGKATVTVYHKVELGYFTGFAFLRGIDGTEPKEPVSLKEYDPETGEMAYKFVEGKTIYSPFEDRQGRVGLFHRLCVPAWNRCSRPRLYCRRSKPST